MKQDNHNKKSLKPTLILAYVPLVQLSVRGTHSITAYTFFGYTMRVVNHDPLSPGGSGETHNTRTRVLPWLQASSRCFHRKLHHLRRVVALTVIIVVVCQVFRQRVR